MIKLNEVPDAKPSARLRTAGIHRKVLVINLDWITKDKDNKPLDKPYVSIQLSNDDGTLNHLVFSPPTRPEEVKYPRDRYEKGSNTRTGAKVTAAEEIEMQFKEVFYMYQQLAMAWRASEDKIAAFKGACQGNAEELFEKMYKAFTTNIPLSTYGSVPIDIKTVWKNSDTNKTSYLNLAKASAFNFVFGPYSENKPTVLEIQKFEKTKMQPKEYEAPATKESLIAPKGGAPRNALKGGADYSNYTADGTPATDDVVF